MRVEDLETFGLIKSLLYLFENEDGVRKIDLRTGAGLAPSTAINIHTILFENQLIENVPDKDRLLFGLTEKGKLIAEKLKEIDKIINNNFKKD